LRRAAQTNLAETTSFEASTQSSPNSRRQGNPEYYPGDALADKAYRLLGPIYAAGLPEIPATPAAVQLGAGSVVHAPAHTDEAIAKHKAFLARHPELHDQPAGDRSEAEAELE